MPIAGQQCRSYPQPVAVPSLPLVGGFVVTLRTLSNNSVGAVELCELSYVPNRSNFQKDREAVDAVDAAELVQILERPRNSDTPARLEYLDQY
jgi:hypothetical protein